MFGSIAAFGATNPIDSINWTDIATGPSMKVTATMATSHQADVTWTASVDAAANPTLAYNVYRLTGQVCPTTPTLTGFTKLNTTAAGATAYTDVGIQPGSYCYSVTALLNGAESLPTTQSQASAVLLPQAPTGTSAQAIP